MPNSTITLQSVVDYARTFPDIAPLISAGGYSTQPALTIASDVMSAIIAPEFPWKWNRFNPTAFFTISWQQDYASLGTGAGYGTQNYGQGGYGAGSMTGMAWIEHCWIIDINNTAQPKPIWPLEAVRDLERTSFQFGRPGAICWLPNDQLVYGTWGANTTPNANNTGQSNPGPNVVYTNPSGATQTPSNPITQIIDTNGNIQVLTTFGTCGAVQPTWPAAAAQPGTTTTDGTCIWTIADPKGQGFRVSPVPPQTGIVYLVNPVGQLRPPQFTTLAQTLEPIPDDFASYFRAGFVAYCYRHSPDPRVRAKFDVEYKLWIASLIEALKKGDRERDSAGFYPTSDIMGGASAWPLGPAWPYGGWGPYGY